MTRSPLVIELFSGTFGWSKGWLELGGRAVGFDLEHLPHHGPVPAGASLTLQDVHTLHGSQFRHASLILASPPCPEYSYMAMPFSRGKQIAAALRGKGKFPDGYTGSRTIEQLNALFNACFRIQREACEAAGRYIPMVVENVKGAQPWVGQAKAHYGSFYLWGDVEMVGDRIIAGGLRWDGLRAAKGGAKIPGQNWSRFIDEGVKSPHWNMQAVGEKTTGHVNKRDGHSHTRHLTNQSESDAVKQPGLSGPAWFDKGAAAMSSKSASRKAASAMIARIPAPLSRYIAEAYYEPQTR